MKWVRIKRFKRGLVVLVVATAMALVPVIPTFAYSINDPGSEIWHQLNANYPGTTVYLTKGWSEYPDQGMGWAHIQSSHGLSESTILQDMATVSNQAISSIYGPEVYLGTTYQNTNDTSEKVTIFMLVAEVDGQWDIVTAYPMLQGKTRERIKSYTDVSLGGWTGPNGTFHTYFPTWIDNNNFSREDVNKLTPHPALPPMTGTAYSAGYSN